MEIMTVTEGTAKTTQILPAATLAYLKQLFEIYLGLSATLPDNISSLIETEERKARVIINRTERIINRKLKEIGSVNFQCAIGLSLYRIIKDGRQDKIDDIAALLETIHIQELILEEESEKDYLRSISDKPKFMNSLFAIIEAMAAWQKILETMKKNKIDPYECQKIINAGKIIYGQQNPESLLETIDFTLKK